MKKSESIYRPWGKYKRLFIAKNYQIKLVTINPKSTLSLQKHLKRSEHWIIIEGELEATIDNKIYNLSENDSLFVPKKTIHRLANKSLTKAKLIEIQRGSYLGEDDILRLEDDYGRVIT